MEEIITFDRLPRKLQNDRHSEKKIHITGASAPQFQKNRGNHVKVTNTNMPTLHKYSTQLTFLIDQ